MPSLSYSICTGQKVLSVLQLLLKNPTYLGVIVMQIADAFLMNGFITFIPKLMENVFTLSASNAALITGPSFGHIFISCKLPLGTVGSFLATLELANLQKNKFN